MSFPRKKIIQRMQSKLREKRNKKTVGVCCQLLRLSRNFEDVASALEIQDVSHL